MANRVNLGVWADTRNVLRQAENAQRNAMRKRRAEENERRTTPKILYQDLRCQGMKAKLIRDSKMHADVEGELNLVPCPAEPSIRIDRFDGRALMDSVPEEDSHKEKKLTKEEQAIESLLCFERYRDLVRVYREGLKEERVIHKAEQEFNAYLSYVRQKELQLAKFKAEGKQQVLEQQQQKAKPKSDGNAFHFDFATGANSIVVDAAEKDSDEEEEEGPDSDDEEDLAAVHDEKEVDVFAREMGCYMYWTIRALDKQNKEEKKKIDKDMYKPLERDTDGRVLTRPERRKLRRSLKEKARMQSVRYDERRRSHSRSPSPRRRSRSRSHSRDRDRGRRRSRSPRRSSTKGAVVSITSFSLDVPTGGDVDVGGTGRRNARADEDVLGASDYEEESVMAGFFPSLSQARKLLEGSDSSRSPSPERTQSPVERPPEPPKEAPKKPPVTAPAVKVPVEKLTPAEKLKRKMAMALNKTIKHDQKTTQEKKQAQRDEQMQSYNLNRVLERKFEHRRPSRSRSRSRSLRRSRSPRGRSRSPVRQRSRSPRRDRDRSPRKRSRSRSRRSTSRSPHRSHGRGRSRDRSRSRDRGGRR